ncbi:MAG: hypothetical protein ACLQVF_12870, partial [Isosphaeraceae bacterium]
LYDIERRNAGPSPYDRPWTPMRLLDGKLWGTKWLIDHLGIDYFGSVVSVDLTRSRAKSQDRANDATLALVCQLGRLESLGLTGTAVTDAGLVYLKGLTSLRNLELGGTQITDAGLDHLKDLTSLVLLNLSSTKVNDAGVIELERVASLPRPGVTDSSERAFQRAMLGASVRVIREEDTGLFDVLSAALEDLDFALSRRFRLSCLLLSRRVQVMADGGQKAELIATCNAVCGLKADDKVSLLKLALTCAACVKSVESTRATAFSAEERQALKDRCADRGIAALARAVELGLLPYLADQRLEPLRRHPGFAPLVEKMKAASAGK